MTSPTPKARTRTAFQVARTASLAAALVLVAQSEWSLALAVGWPGWIAWAAPVALDAYILAAVTARRDLGPSVVVSAASVVGSHAVYAAPAAWGGGIVGPSSHLVWQLAACCSVVPLLVTWRVHHLRLSDALAEAGPVDAPDSAPPQTATAAAAEGASTAGVPPAKRACPSREAARQILLSLDPVAFETTSNAELARRHGGSDVWWGKRRAVVATELASLGGR